MKSVSLLLFGLLVGLLAARRRPARVELILESDELATPSIFRRTRRLTRRSLDPVS